MFRLCFLAALELEQVGLEPHQMLTLFVYVGFVTYTLYPSMDVGPHRDLVGNLTSSVRAAGLHMGLYHSLREWYNPLYEQDNADNCSTTTFVDEVLQPTLKDMVLKYKVNYYICIKTSVNTYSTWLCLSHC